MRRWWCWSRRRCGDGGVGVAVRAAAAHALGYYSFDFMLTNDTLWISKEAFIHPVLNDLLKHHEYCKDISVQLPWYKIPPKKYWGILTSW